MHLGHLLALTRYFNIYPYRNSDSYFLNIPVKYCNWVCNKFRLLSNLNTGGAIFMLVDGACALWWNLSSSVHFTVPSVLSAKQCHSSTEAYLTVPRKTRQFVSGRRTMTVSENGLHTHSVFYLCLFCWTRL